MFAVPTIAATSTKLTTTETSIVKAYQKSIESEDAKYINAYKYPGVTFNMEKYGEGIKAKFITANYSKDYDSKKKLYKLNIAGILVTTDGTSLHMANVTTSMYIKTSNKKVYAFEEIVGSIKDLTVGSLTQSQLTALENYLVSVYGDDKTQTLMYPDMVKGDGTMESPIELNQKYTWNLDKDYAYDHITGTCSLTVKSAKKITTSDIAKLGFKKPKEDSSVEYLLVNVIYQVKNAKLTKGSNGSGYSYLTSAWGLDIWGTKTTDGGSYIGGCTDYGFDGSLGRVSDKYDKKITSGMAAQSYKAQGNMILQVVKGKTYYMCIRNEAIEDYDSSFVYFKLTK
jgi:hypothetical protein